MRVELAKIDGHIIYANVDPVTGAIENYQVTGVLSKRKIRVRFIDPTDSKRDQYLKDHNTARIVTAIPHMVLEVETIRHPSGTGWIEIITSPEYVIEGL